MKIRGTIICLFLIILCAGLIHCTINANNFSPDLLAENVDSLFKVQIQNNSEEDARLYFEEGLKLFTGHQYIHSETYFLKAVKLAEYLNEKEILAYSFHYLGNIESWKSNFYQSILYHKSASDLFKKLDNLERIAISNNNIASGFYDLGDYDSTIVYYKKNIENLPTGNFDNTTYKPFFGFALSKKKTDSQETRNIDNIILVSYQGLATLYAKLYNYKEAYSYLQQGISCAEETGSSLLLAELYFTAGNLFLNNHVNKDIALEYLEKAKNIFAEESNWQYVNLANLSIGDVFYKTGKDSLAMKYFRSVAKKVGSNNLSLLSKANHMIGMVFKSNKQYDSALVYLQKSIDVMCKVCPEIVIHTTLLEAANTNLILGNTQQAFFYLNRARNIAVDTESGLEMVVSYEELAKYYQSIHSKDSVVHYLMMAHNMAIELGLLKNIKSTAESLSRIYYSKEEFQKSSNYLKLSNQLNDSLANIERYNQIAKLEMRFEIEKREEERKLEAKIMQSEITKQKLIRNVFIAGVVFFIIFGILIMRAYHRKRRDNKLLAKQKKEIQGISLQLQESSKRKLDFFTNISHEIRTPLTLIKSPLERILKTNKFDHGIDSQLDVALKNTNKLKELVNQILDLQKLDENMLGLDLTSFELIAFCKEIVASFEGYCYQSNCKLIFKANVNKAIVRFDKIRLQSIINNLLSNAFKYNKENGLVQFKLEVKQTRILLEIQDTGIGISNENLKKLGERYYQVEKPNVSVEGTGIGLAYVKELVELINGNLEISSTINEGTTVSVSLPCDEIEMLKESFIKKEIIPKEQLFDQLEEQLLDNSSGLPSVLIIEDNLELRIFLRDLFALNYHVICAKDGQEGKELALKHIPDIIISDIMMPGIKGNKLCRILKNNIVTSHITIILFTAKDSPDSIIDGYDCGADDYIVKPFDTDLLLKKVKNIIATGENARKQFSFGDIDRSTTVFSEFDKKFLNGCFSIIKDNIDNSNFTVEFLAEKMSVHRRTLLRKFNALTGKSPIDLIRHIRMSKAAELINENYRVNEVALMVGYEDTNRFSQAFKQFHGVSPSAFS